jgi:hypothetical protein
MPLNQYIVLKKAVEIDAIVSRRQFIYDVNRANHDAKPVMDQLEKELMTLLHGKKKTSSVSWAKNDSWKTQLSKYQI